MIGLDTNVLVRYITQDGPEAEAAARVLEETCTCQRPGFVPLICICELVWVLDRAYGYTRRQVVEILRRLLETKQLKIETPDLVWAGLIDYETGPADFSDYLLARVCRQREALPVYTLDKKAGKSPLFHLIVPIHPSTAEGRGS